MAGVEGQRMIRGTSARRGLSGRTFGAAFDPVLLAYGVLPATCLIVEVDFAGVSRLPANSVGVDRLKAKIGPRLAASVWVRGCFGGRWIGRERYRWTGGCLVEVSVAQTSRDSEVQPDGYGLFQGRYKQRRLACAGL
jgi:hypothetical protein